MAQGTKKLKPRVGTLKKDKTKHKKQEMKKGSRYIAPKKARHVEADKLKRGLEKAIKTNIENEITQKVQSIEPKSFKLIKSSDTDASTSSSSSKAGHSKQK